MIGEIASFVKEISEVAKKSKFADSPLGKSVEGKSFDKPIAEYDKPFAAPNDAGGKIENTGLSDEINENIQNMEQYEIPKSAELKENEGLTDEEKAKIKEETGWSDEIIENIQNMEQYEILKSAGLKEAEINGRACLIKENIDLDYKDADGVSNQDRISRGLAPLDSKTGKPIELHHLGQKADSPLVELTEEEHRTGVSEDGSKNQSIWHDNTKDTEVHGEGNNWNEERKAHWETRSSEIEGGNS
jgi:hypothetical protein